LAGHIKLASADSQLIHVYLEEYNACHQSTIQYKLLQYYQQLSRISEAHTIPRSSSRQFGILIPHDPHD